MKLSSKSGLNCTNALMEMVDKIYEKQEEAACYICDSVEEEETASVQRFNIPNIFCNLWNCQWKKNMGKKTIHNKMPIFLSNHLSIIYRLYVVFYKNNQLRQTVFPFINCYQLCIHSNHMITMIEWIFLIPFPWQTQFFFVLISFIGIYKKQFKLLNLLIY